ncbi:MAG: hypothetical protein RLZZ156_348 [Deinococcota bacterium]|jgi:O-antigen/teichoic acid export membrane protein
MSSPTPQFAALRFMAVQLLIQIATYGYYAFLARLLEPNHFSKYIGLTACVSVYMVLGIAVQQAAAQRAAKQQSMTISSHLLWLGLGITAVAAPVLQHFAQIPWAWILGLAICTPFYIALSVWRGVQLAQASVYLEHNFLLEHGSKILLTLLLGLVVSKPDAAGFAIPISIIVAALHSRFFQPTALTLGRTVSNNPFLISTFLQLLSSNLDVVLAQVFLPPAQATIYAQSALLARVMLFFATALIQAHTKQLLAHAQFARHLAIWLIAAGIAYLLAVMLFGQLVLSLMYGTSQNTLEVWGLLALAATVLSLGGLYIQQQLLHGSNQAAWLWLFCIVLQTTGMFFWHDSALTLGVVQLVTILLWLGFIGFYQVIQDSKGSLYVLRKFFGMA